MNAFWTVYVSWIVGCLLGGVAVCGGFWLLDRLCRYLEQRHV